MNNYDPIKCREYYQCGRNECPAFDSKDLRCWLQSKTYCHDEIRGIWIEKIEVCLVCDVFKRNISVENMDETLKTISLQFKDITKKLEAEREDLKESQKKLMEFKTTSVYLLKELDKKNKEIIDEKNNLEIKVEARTKELKEIHERLFQASKVAALSRFSAGIAHEINNPLGAIINYTRTILANPELKNETRGYTELVLKGLFRIENIVKQILSYSGRQKAEETDINKLITDTLVFLQHKMREENVKVKLKLNDKLHCVFLDPHQLQQVFINIIRNAADAMKNVDKKEIEIETFKDDGKLYIKFADIGKGIKKEDLEKIFTPFYTTKEVGEGTGLGLFISYNIIQLFQGEINIQSVENKGTTVIISFPLLQTKDS